MSRLSILTLWLALGSMSCIVVSPDDNDVRLDEYDADGDSYYSTEVGGGDCDDEDATINPGADEVCDGFDNDCSGGVDEMLTTIEFPDADGDGFGDSNAPTIVCPRTEGYAELGGDCNDDDATINPEAVEACDELDNDCDGVADDSLGGTWFNDLDGDGYGAGAPTTSCDPDTGLVADNRDCDDASDTTFPGADELCDNKDNDCDGAADEDLGDTAWFLDLDGDSYGDPTEPSPSCGEETGYVNNGDDCDDTDFTIHPTSTDIACSGVDENCDGDLDETDGDTVYPDEDDDGFGDENRPASACDEPTWTITNGDDCNDNDDTVYLGATELCDEQDNDCDVDGEVDEGAPPDFTYYPDVDGDGYANESGTPVDSCSQPADHVLLGSCQPDSSLLTQAACEAVSANMWQANVDCDDAVEAVNPSEVEICDDGLDNDCSGLENDPSTDDGRDDPCP